MSVNWAERQRRTNRLARKLAFYLFSLPRNYSDTLKIGSAGTGNPDR